MVGSEQALASSTERSSKYVGSLPTPEAVARQLQELLVAIAAHSDEGAGHLAIVVVGLHVVGDALDALALLEEPRFKVLDLGLELLDARLVLGLERAVCARSGWARRRGGCLDEDEVVAEEDMFGVGGGEGPF